MLPGTDKLCGGSTLVPEQRFECHCFHHSETRFDKCTVTCFSVSSCKHRETTETEVKLKKNTDNWKTFDSALIPGSLTGLACVVYPVRHRPPPVHCHSHTGHFFSSSYTHSCVCGLRLCPLQPPLGPGKATGTCCPNFPSLPFQRKKHAKNRASETAGELSCLIAL